MRVATHAARELLIGVDIYPRRAFVAKTKRRLSIKKQPAFDATRKQNNKHMYGMNKSRLSVAAHKSRVRLSDSRTLRFFHSPCAC